MNWRRLMFWRKPREKSSVDRFPRDDGKRTTLFEWLADQQPKNARVEWFEACDPLPLIEIWNGIEYHVLKSNFNPSVIVDHANNIIWQEAPTLEQLSDDILCRVSDGVVFKRIISVAPDGAFHLTLSPEISRADFVPTGYYIPFLDLPPITD